MLSSKEITRVFVCYTIIGTHSVDVEEDIHCPNRCGRKYKHKGSVARHLKYECGVNPKFECVICRKPFKQRINHKIHMIRIHNCVIYNAFLQMRIPSSASLVNRNEEVILCPQNCGRSYKNIPCLNKHLKYECNKAPQFRCLFCDKRSKRPDNLRTHMQPWQSATAQGRGNTTWQRLQTEDDLNAADKNGSPRGSHAYNTTSLLNSSEDVYLCPQNCEAVNCFVCNDCGRSYKYKRSLQNHQEFDCEARPIFTIILFVLVAVNCFMCNNCGRSYKYKRSLFAHQKFECGVQPKFGCHICSKKFSQKGSLRSHLIMIHNTF
ncbi:gastrula zinc finger protein XlCGF58.1-like [Metopolophium dirhodum]|uniref:gastrula zinc finger protein XlCGF58.1-like n=1 Tax=Metopolophium dirhodum TaxID=44670 RepID=UPI00298F9E0F|nr:gastrula zinc finger protein XlCGF58.1-like [Metopolophium dirhodum]